MGRWFLVLTLLGCATQTKEPPGADPTAAASTPIITPKPPTVAQKPPAERLLGAWVIDPEYIATDPDLLKLPPEQRAEAMKMAEALVARTRMEFAAPDRFTLRMGEASQDGTWRLESETAAGLELDVEMKKAEAPPRKERVAVEFVGEKLLFTGDDGKTVRLRRE